MTTAKHASNPSITNADPVHRKPRATNLPPADDPGERGGPPSPPNNLSLPRSPLIGRDHEVATIQQLLLQEHVGLLTLTGPGGIGKTRLALQVAANLLDHFVDGVYFVSLAPISDPDLVSATIAQTLGVREAPGRSLQESLQDYVRDKQLLLVLDNFEQILTAAPLVSALLNQCHRLKILVTSRAPLHLYGEQEFSVSPLSLPDAKRLSAQEKAPTSSQSEFAAIDLFCQRAKAVKPDFTLTADNAAAVTQICIGLDGLPLALELAAARIKLFSPSALLARLDQRLTLLTGGAHDLPTRQRTLRDEIAWSYDLLTPDEQTLFSRLAVFVGGFTLEAAQAVGNPSTTRAWAATGSPKSGSGQVLGIDVLKGVATLVDHNLLKPLEANGGEARFGMLETIREYGLEQLAASGEAEEIRRGHGDFFVTWAEANELELAGPQRKQASIRLQTELDNLRAVLNWSDAAPNSAEVGLRLAGALIWFGMSGNYYAEMYGWLTATLRRATAPTAIRAKALWGAGLLAMTQGDHGNARKALQESVALCRAIGNTDRLASALRELCLVAHSQHQFSEAQRYGEESVALHRALGNQGGLVIALDNLGATVAAQGDLATAATLFAEELTLAQSLNDLSLLGTVYTSLGWLAGRQANHLAALTYFKQSLTLRQELEEKWVVAETLCLMGEILQRQAEFGQANQHYTASLALARDVGDKTYIAQILYCFGMLAQSQLQPARAICLVAAATKLQEMVGGFVMHTLVDLSVQAQAMAPTRALVGEETFAAKWREGQALTLKQAIDYALTSPVAPETAPKTGENYATTLPSRTYPADLTAREVEVLRLLAQGLTYAQIADKLIITRRTVNGHVTSIYSKLGVNGRAAATRLAAKHGLV